MMWNFPNIYIYNYIYITYIYIYMENVCNPWFQIFGKGPSFQTKTAQKSYQKSDFSCTHDWTCARCPKISSGSSFLTRPCPCPGGAFNKAGLMAFFDFCSWYWLDQEFLGPEHIWSTVLSTSITICSITLWMRRLIDFDDTFHDIPILWEILIVFPCFPPKRERWNWPV